MEKPELDNSRNSQGPNLMKLFRFIISCKKKRLIIFIVARTRRGAKRARKGLNESYSSVAHPGHSVGL